MFTAPEVKLGGLDYIFLMKWYTGWKSLLGLWNIHLSSLAEIASSRLSVRFPSLHHGMRKRLCCFASFHWAFPTRRHLNGTSRPAGDAEEAPALPLCSEEPVGVKVNRYPKHFKKLLGGGANQWKDVHSGKFKGQCFIEGGKKTLLSDMRVENRGRVQRQRGLSDREQVWDGSQSRSVLY